ncbi:hypothetical protein J6894_01022 [Nakaseomyces glabratus]|nr:hypothetical protein J6894_01022 [Nakaseomyces glabratus]
MKYLSVFATFVAILSWACATVYPNFYKDKTIVLDGMGTEEFTIPRDKILSLVNTSLTLKNFAHISIGEGVLIQEKSLVTIIPPIGTSRKFNFTVRGLFDLENESKFIFDGSGNTYEDEADAVNNFVFDIYGNSSGIQVYKGNTVSVTLPTIKNSIPNYQGESPHIRFAGSTVDQFIFEPPYVFVSLMIIAGKFEVLSPGSKTGSQFDKVIWRVDFGVSGLPKTNPNTPSYIRDKLTGEITCEGILAVYNDMFAFTNNAVLHTLGYIGYSVVSPITLDLSMGPIRRPTNYEYLVALPAGQDGITLTGYKYTADTDISNAHQYLFYYFYDNDATKEDEISVSTDNSDVRILHSNPSQTVTVHGDSALNIGYYKGDRIDSFVGFDGLDFSKYKKELAVYFYESFQYSSTTTTKSDEYTTEIIEIIVSGTLGIDNKPSPVTISSTIYNQLRETTEIVDLGNGVTEYHVLDYFPVPQDNKEHPYGTSTKIITYSPPPVTITATTAADYVETDWISFFITTNDKGEIITDSTLFNATRDYNLPEAPHTSFGPAPPAETKTVDLGNEVTEYLVISYWTTTNEFGGLITTSSTRTYSPPPVTITATTAADYVETDWISFFITTNDKGEIITDSTLFNATRDYNLPEAPHTSFGPAPPAETKTVDLGNEVTEYLVISYWTTTNEFGGLITTSSTRTYSPPPVTITATTAADYVETDWISFFITTNDKGEIITDSTLFNATRDYNLPEAPHTSFGPAPPAETKTVDLGNEVTEYLVISYWTTTNEFGGLITTSSTRTYSPPPVTITATTAADYVETDWISFFITTNDKGEIITDSTLFNATREYIDAEAPHLSSSMKDVLPESEADYTTTIDKGNGEFETDLVSHITTKDSDGKPTTITTTIPLKPSEAGEAGEADYTTTIISDGHTITEVVSHVTTTDSDGKTITYITTMASYDQVDEGVFTSAAPYSQPPVVTSTITEDDGSSKTVVISYFPSEGEDGVTRTGTTTVSTITPGEADYTTTIISDGHTITEVVSHVTTTDSDGKTITYITTMASYDQVDEGVFTSAAPYSQPPVVTSTITEDDGSSKTVVISYFPSEGEDGVTRTGTTTVSTITPGEADYTTTIISDGHTITEVVSHVTTTDSDGKTITYITTMASYDQVDEGVFTSAAPYSQPPVVTSTITEDDGSSKTVVISYFPSEGEDGVTRTGTTTVSTITPGEADYTTTIISDGHTITEVVSHVTTTDSDGKTITYITTMASYDQVDEGVFTSAAPYSQPPVVTSTITEDDGSSKTVVISYFPSEGEDGVTRTGTTTVSTITPGEADYTTTIISDGHTITEVVSHVTTTDSDGKTITYITTMASYDQVDEGVFTSAAPYSQPPVVTSTITEDDGSSKTVVISYFPSEGEDGVTRTGTTTVSTITPGEADYTTTIISDGHTITEVVSHVTTTDSDGKTITYITTMASYDQVDEGVFTSAAPYSQPPVVTSTITEDDGSSKTVVISYFPSEGEDGVTRTGTTTVSTITPGEADYTTTIISDGHTITEVVSHVTTTDSDGKTITYITTIFSNDWLLVDSELDVKSNHPTSVVSKENPYTTVDSQSTISSNSGNTVVTTKTPANGNENHGLSSVNGTSVSSGRNTIPSVSLIITNTLGFAGPINKPSYSTTSASSSVPQEVARDSSKYGENVSSVGIMLPQMSKPHASSASISVVHSSSRPVISTGSRPSDVSARPTENTPTFGSMPVQSGAENDASVSSTNDNQNTHTAQSRLQQLGKTSSDLGTTALLIPSSSAVNISHTGGPSDTQIASVLQGSGFKIKANKSEVMILLVTVFLFLGIV